MNNYFKRIIIAVICLMFIVLANTRGTIYVPFFSNAINKTLNTAAYIVTKPVTFIGDLIFDISKLHDANNENNKIKSTIENIKFSELDYQRLKAENETLKQSLELSSTSKFISAYVDFQSTNKDNSFITITKGSTSNINVGNIVSGNIGVIGYVESVEKNNAKIRLLNSKIQPKKLFFTFDSNNTVISSIDSVDGSKIILNKLVADNIKEGDKLITSNLDKSTAFLEVGKVTEIKKDIFGMKKIITVKASEEIIDLLTVKVWIK